MASILKKGGDARYVISAVALNDAFVVPKGFKLREFIGETMGTVTTTAPGVYVGTTKSVNQVSTITVANTAGVASTVFSIGGVASSVQIAASNTVAQTVALILSQFGKGGAQYGALLNAGWTVSAHATDATKVALIGSPSKTSTLPTIVTTGLTTQTLTGALITTGVASVEIMTSQTLPTTASTVKDFTANIVAGKQFVGGRASANQTCYVATDLNAVGNTNFYAVLQKLN